MVKIAKRPFEALTELLKRDLDDRLRVVLRVDPSGIERLFIRNDLALRSDDELADSFARIVPGVRELADLLDGGADEPEALVTLTDMTVALLLYRHQNELVAIGYDRAEDGGLGEFIEQCLETIH